MRSSRARSSIASSLGRPARKTRAFSDWPRLVRGFFIPRLPAAPAQDLDPDRRATAPDRGALCFDQSVEREVSKLTERDPLDREHLFGAPVQTAGWEPECAAFFVGQLCHGTAIIVLLSRSPTPYFPGGGVFFMDETCPAPVGLFRADSSLRLDAATSQSRRAGIAVEMTIRIALVHRTAVVGDDPVLRCITSHCGAGRDRRERDNSRNSEYKVAHWEPLSDCGDEFHTDQNRVPLAVIPAS
jgi:hypothetical protein